MTSALATFPYRAYTENFLHLELISKFSFGVYIKDNQLTAAEFWNKGEAVKFETFDEGPIKSRIRHATESKSVELMRRLHLDLAMQEKYCYSLTPILYAHSLKKISRTLDFAGTYMPDRQIIGKF